MGLMLGIFLTCALYTWFLVLCRSVRDIYEDGQPEALGKDSA